MALRMAQMPRAVPGAIAVMDGKFVPCGAPMGYMKDFKSIKGRGFTLHVVCDADLRIVDLVSGYAATTHDSTVFSNSYFGEQSAEATRLQKEVGDLHRMQPGAQDEIRALRSAIIQRFDERRVPFPAHTQTMLFVIGDGAYPLRRHIMVPYTATHAAKGSSASHLSAHLSSIRVRSEHLFGVLAKQWRSIDDW